MYTGIRNHKHKQLLKPQVKILIFRIFSSRLTHSPTKCYQNTSHLIFQIGGWFTKNIDIPNAYLSAFILYMYMIYSTIIIIMVKQVVMCYGFVIKISFNDEVITFITEKHPQLTQTTTMVPTAINIGFSQHYHGC